MQKGTSAGKRTTERRTRTQEVERHLHRQTTHSERQTEID